MTCDAVGGVWSYTTDLAVGLARRGLQVTVAVIGPSPRVDQMFVAPRGVDLVDTGLALDWLAGDERSLVAAGHELARMARQVGADIIHLSNPSYAADGGFDRPVVGVCHSCLGTWWDSVRGGSLPSSFRWHTERLARGYVACDALIAPSRSFSEATAKWHDVSAVVVPNGRSARARSSLPKDDFVLTSGRLWDAGKNILALDRAAAFMDGEVRAAGPLHGPDGATVALRTITSLGRLDATSMAASLDRAMVFASLALYEPFGLGVLEAAQAACALVLADIPTFRELWSGAAVFVDPADARHVAAVLDGLLDDPAEAARLGRLAAIRAARFSVERMVDGTLAVYGAVCPATMRRVGVAA